MSRLRERQETEEPKRVKYALNALESLGLNPIYKAEMREIDFLYNGNTIRLFPYSGWFSGKGIKDGRGIKNLLKQLQ